MRALLWSPHMAAVLLLFVSIEALDSQTVSAGDRVRATGEEQSGKLVGTVAKWSSDTVYVVPDGSSEGAAARALYLSNLSKLEIGKGLKSNAGKGALIGGGIGLLIGGTLAIVGGTSGDTEVTAIDYLAFTGIFTAGGAGLGALIGSFSKSERWEEYPLDRLRLGVGSRGDGSLQITVAWRLR